MEPTIYVAPDHHRSDIIRWMVEAKEAPLRVKYVPFQGINLGVPPFYYDGEVLLTEFWTLVEFLQERYPGEQLMPHDPLIRAQMRQACREVHESVDLWPDLESILRHGTPYLAGRECSMVDLFAKAWMKYGGIEFVSNGVVVDYYNRLGQLQ